MIFRPLTILVALALLVLCAAVAETHPATSTIVGYGTTATGRVVGSLGFSPMTPGFRPIGGNFRVMTPGFGQLRSHFRPMGPRFRSLGPNIRQFPAGQFQATPSFGQQTNQPFRQFYRNSFGEWHRPFAQSYRYGFNWTAPNFGPVGP